MGLNWTDQQYNDYLARQEQAMMKGVNLDPDTTKMIEDAQEKNLKRVLAMFPEPEPPFKSKTERRAWNEWVPTTGCVEAYYEAMRIYLNSGSYRPDFTLRMPNRELWFVEVKGSWKAYQSGRSSKKSLKEAARMYWWLGRWFSLLPSKEGGWKFEEIT